MRKALKFFGLIASTLALCLIVAVLAFYHLIRDGELHRFLISEIEARTEFKVQLGEADLAVGRILGIGFNDFALAEPGVARPIVTARRITARVALLPLFERKVILYGVRLHQPTAHVVRDKEGRIPLLEKLRNLAFLTQEASSFGLDLHAIGIQDGEVDFDNQQAEQGPRTTQFRAIDLDIRPMRGQRLLAFVRELANRKQPEPQGAALDFNLKTEVVAGKEKTPLRARGRMVFPEETLDFRQTWWNADLQLDNLSAQLLGPYVGAQWLWRAVSGVFAPRLHLEGSPEAQIRLRGALSFKQLAIDVPDLFATPLLPGDGQADFDVYWKPERLSIALLDFRSNELKFRLQGETRLNGAQDTHARLNLAAPALPLVIVRRYLPLKLVAWPPVETFLASLQGGELQLNKLGINGTLGELRNVAQSVAGGHIGFEGELRNVSLKPTADGYLPVEEGQGLIRLEKGTLTFTDFKANYGQSRFTDIDGTYELAPEREGDFDFHAAGELDLAEMREQMTRGVFPSRLTKLSSSLEELGGNGRIQLNFRRSGDAAPYFEGQVLLDNARLRFDEISLTEVKGDLAVSPEEIRTEKLTALLSNSPVQIQLSLTQYASEAGRFDLQVESTGVKAGIVSRLLLSTGSPEDPGMVGGSVRYEGAFASQGNRQFTGALDLSGVQLDHPPLLQPLRELSGRVSFDETGIDFQSLKGLLVGFPVEFSGRWRYAQKPQLVFNFSAPSLDVAYLLSQIDPESTEWYATLTAQGEVSLDKGSLKGFEFTELKTDLNLDRRVWRLENSTMRSAGGAVQGAVTIVDKPDRVTFALAPKIQGVSSQGILRWFEASQTELTGKVNLTGNLESAGNGSERERNLNGELSLRIEDGTIQRMRVLVQILNLLDLSRWFSLKLPDLNKEGIRFRSISGNFTVQQGVFSTEKLIVDSDDLRMTGSGKIDLANDEIQFVLAVRPFAGIDTAIGYLPLIGRGIAAVKNSFLVASFNINGPIENPTITPAPLSTLSEWVFGVLGIPKNAIGWGGEEKKAEPRSDPQKEPPEEKMAPTTK
ncbi:MAG TPA: AsmA-like C-terminal domain-containing protein [Candidatus Binatia bacterium]|nr:AsmA-like C-terminal domain-containing protein [Candidatus Binatia bacterium]